MIDPSTCKVMDPKEMDKGHKPGNEWHTKKMRQEQGHTRQKVLEADKDPGLYHYEDRKENGSHKHEKKEFAQRRDRGCL